MLQFIIINNCSIESHLQIISEDKADPNASS